MLKPERRAEYIAIWKRDGETGARRWADQQRHLLISDDDVRAGQRAHAKAEYSRLSASSPIAAALFAKANPVVYEEEPKPPAEAPLNPFALATAREQVRAVLPQESNVTVTPAAPPTVVTK